jgi:two-component system nitrogen regulation sensor histidine kinase NtrY
VCSSDLRLTQVRDESGKGLGLVVVIEDLTELERAQRMAAWREVARRIAHEIKNPLTPIKLSAQRLMKRFGGEVAEKDVFDQAVTIIVDQADALKGLVDEFSAFARMPSASLEQADLGAILGEALALFKEAHKEIAFEVVVKTPPPAFPFDPTQVKRVLINLLGNAVAALEGQPEPRVTIRLNYLAELKLARIEVADNGPGLTGETRERLFEPYYSTKRQGVGLGLAIVKTIIQDHNGYIRVQDNAPRGTKFIIELPCGGWTAELEVKKDAPDHPRG